MLYFTKHPEGPELSEDMKDKKFRSYVDAANWADAHNLLPGKYWLRNSNGTNLMTAIREVTYTIGKHGGKSFYVDGRGNI